MKRENLMSLAVVVIALLVALCMQSCSCSESISKQGSFRV
jgi:hypothetical protein